MTSTTAIAYDKTRELIIIILFGNNGTLLYSSIRYDRQLLTNIIEKFDLTLCSTSSKVLDLSFFLFLLILIRATNNSMVRHGDVYSNKRILINTDILLCSTRDMMLTSCVQI